MIMATLRSGDLSWEISFAGYPWEWVEYRCTFRWQETHLLNDRILRRDSDYRKERPEGSLLALDDKKDTLIPLLQSVLKTNRPNYWEPIEPDIMIGVYPEMYFPFLKGQERVFPEAGKKPSEENPFITLIVFADTRNFAGGDTYGPNGISLHMTVRRDALEAFVEELKREYESFCKQYGVI